MANAIQMAFNVFNRVIQRDIKGKKKMNKIITLLARNVLVRGQKSWTIGAILCKTLNLTFTIPTVPQQGTGTQFCLFLFLLRLFLIFLLNRHFVQLFREVLREMKYSVVSVLQLSVLSLIVLMAELLAIELKVINISDLLTY